MLKTDVNMKTVLAERLSRNHLVNSLDDPTCYAELFRLLQPVSPVAFSRPGDPPRLVHRIAFDDGAIADQMREGRSIVKGRFLGGIIGYVLTSDLELYANAFCRHLSELNAIQEIVFEAIRTSETLTPRQIKEETGLLNKQIMPALHRLQEAFLVYEDQIDSDWERNWYEFATEWPEINLDEGKREASAVQVLSRFLKVHVFATFEQLKDWSRLPTKLLRTLVRNMEEDKTVVPQLIENLGEGWICNQDSALRPRSVPPSAFMLHKSDILVRSHASELKQRFRGQEILQYLLIDGMFLGAVLGHWRIGPHDVEDILIELPAAERTDRREEILNAVSWHYRPPHSHILKYDGKEIRKISGL